MVPTSIERPFSPSPQFGLGEWPPPTFGGEGRSGVGTGCAGGFDDGGGGAEVAGGGAGTVVDVGAVIDVALTLPSTVEHVGSGAIGGAAPSMVSTESLSVPFAFDPAAHNPRVSAGLRSTIMF